MRIRHKTLQVNYSSKEEGLELIKRDLFTHPPPIEFPKQ